MDELVRSVLTVPGLIVVVAVTALVSGAVALGYQRLGKRLDAKSEAKAAAAKAAATGNPEPSAPAVDAQNVRAAEKFLRKIATQPPRYAGPNRWLLNYVSELGHYQLEHTGPDTVHDLKVDVFTTGARPRFVWNQTIRVPQLPAEVPLSLALGAPSRAWNYAISVRWDDEFGVEQFDRLGIATHAGYDH